MFHTCTAGAYPTHILHIYDCMGNTCVADTCVICKLYTCYTPNFTYGKDFYVLATYILKRRSGMAGPITWFNPHKPGPQSRASVVLCVHFQ